MLHLSWLKKSVIARFLVVGFSMLAVMPAHSKDNPVAKTIIARGEVYALPPTAKETRRLRRRSPVFQGDSITTGIDSKTQIRFKNGGMFALRDQSELTIKQASPADSSVAVIFRKGGIRIVLSDTAKGLHKLSMPRATIDTQYAHYQIEIVDDQVYVALWDGKIALDLMADGVGNAIDLNTDKGHAFVKINPHGKLTHLMVEPKVFAK
jgi:hypothetical protein